MFAIEGAGVDQHGSAVNNFEVVDTGEGSLSGGFDVDVDIVLERRGSSVVVVETDGVELIAAANLGAVDDGFGGSVAIVVVERCVVAGADGAC